MVKMHTTIRQRMQIQYLLFKNIKRQTFLFCMERKVGMYRQFFANKLIRKSCRKLIHEITNRRQIL